MGRVTSTPPLNYITKVNASTPWRTALGRQDPFGFMQLRLFAANTNFTIPAGISAIRVTCRAEGGKVIAGAMCAFGSLISATGGGAASGGVGGAGGIGIGGDVQWSGGRGGDGTSSTTSRRGGGGGQAGNPLGNGLGGGLPTATHGGSGGGFPVDPAAALHVVGDPSEYARYIGESFFPGTPYDGRLLIGAASGVAGTPASWCAGTGGEWRAANGSGVIAPAAPLAGGGRGGVDGGGGGGGGGYASGVLRVVAGTVYPIQATPEAIVVVEW